jgi:hypothetical protein
MKKMEKDILEDIDEKPREKKGNKQHDPLGVTMKIVNKNHHLPFSPGMKLRRRRAPNGRKISQISIAGYNQKPSLGSNKRFMRHVTDGGYARKIPSEEEIGAGTSTTKELSAPER